MSGALRRALARFARREDGAATIEVAMFFPLIMWPFMMAMELGLLQIRQTMLERSTDIVVRDLRLGDPDLDDPEALKAAVCDEMLVMPDCGRDLFLEMARVSVVDFDYDRGSRTCIDRREEVNPVTDFTAGATNELMILQFCVLHDPILPHVGLGRILPMAPGGGFPLTATSFFVNEPR